MKKPILKIGLIAGAAVLIGLMAFGAFHGLAAARRILIEDVNLVMLPDGDHTGSFSLARWTYTAVVKLEKGRITAVSATAGGTGRADDFCLKASAEVVNAQSPLIDTVSGASLNTKVFAKAVQNALTKPWTEPRTGMRFTWIPGGRFTMGSPKSDPAAVTSEYPLHEVRVDGFWMGQHEVTNAQYRKWDTGYSTGTYKGFSLDADDQPVGDVSWLECVAYAEWLTGLHGGAVVFRLPTEAEWEYAARAGTRTIRYWGENPRDACKHANVADSTAEKNGTDWGMVFDCDDGYAVSSPVGSFPPNAFGLYDMLGNVWEWTWDWLENDYYSRSPADNPTGPDTGQYRTARGGSWMLLPDLTRCATRFSDIPEGVDPSWGFRLLIQGKPKP